MSCAVHASISMLSKPTPQRPIAERRVSPLRDAEVTPRFQRNQDINAGQLIRGVVGLVGGQETVIDSPQEVEAYIGEGKVTRVIQKIAGEADAKSEIGGHLEECNIPSDHQKRTFDKLFTRKPR